MFVHAFLVVASGQVLYVSRAKRQVLYVSRAKRRAYVVYVWSARVVSGPAGQRVQLSCGAMAHVYVPSASAWYKRRSLGTTAVRITRKASRVSRLLVRRIRDARARRA